MDCENCGRTNDPEARYCASCGVALDAVAVAQSDGGSIPTRGLGALIEETFRVYRASFWQFVAIAAVPAAASVLGNVFNASDELALDLLGSIFILASVVLSVVAAGAIAFGVARHYVRGEVNVGDCLSHAFQVGVFLIAQAIVFTVVIGGLFIVGTILFVVGAIAGVFEGGSEGAVAGLVVVGALMIIAGIVVAIWLGVRWFSAAFAVVIEGKGPIAGLGRSWSLVTGSWWRVFGILLVFAVAITGVIVVIAIPLGIIGGIAGSAAAGAQGAIIVGAIAGALATVVVTPFAYIASTLIYFDLRVRKEGFDLDDLTAETSRV